MKVEESLNVTFDESPAPTKLSPLVNDDVGEEDAIIKNTKIVNTNNEEDALIEAEEILCKKRFGGNKETKKVQKTLLKQQYENFSGLSSERLDQIHDWLQKLISQLEILADIEDQSLDDLFNNLKIYEAEVKSSSSTSHTTKNIAFVSSNNTDSTNESVSVVPSVSAASTKALISALPNMDNLSDAIIYSFFARDGSQVADGHAYHESQEVECYNYHRRAHFARECRSPRDARNKDTQRRTVPVETFTSNALVSQCDGVGSYDWSFQADEEPTNYALMAFTSSSSSSSDNEVIDCDELNSSESDDSVPTSPVHDRYKSGEGYHVVPPPYTGTFMPSKPDLVFHDASTVNETVPNVFNVKPKDESKGKPMPTQKEPSYVQTSKHVKTPRTSVKPIELPTQAENLRKDILKSRVLTRSRLVPLNAFRPVTTDVPQTNDNPQQALKDKCVIDSGCSRHMTGNMSYLSDFEEINRGYVAFGSERWVAIRCHLLCRVIWESDVFRAGVRDSDKGHWVLSFGGKWVSGLSPQVVSTAKLPILNPNEFDLWKMRIEQYFLMTDYSLWEVILNGDTPASTRVIDGVLQPVAPTTAEQRLARKNELKARGTLLMDLPDKHQLKFNTSKDAKTLMEAIEKKLQKLISQLEIFRVSLSQEDINLKFLRSLPTEWRTHTLIWRNKTDLEEQSLNDLFNSLKIYEAEVKSSSSACITTQNIVFVSSSNTDSTNEPVSVAASVFAIDAVDIEEMDLKWQMAILTVRARQFLQRTGRNLRANGPTSIGFDMSKVECYNCHRKGQFARECRSPKDTRRNDAAEPQKRNVLVETSTLNALVSQCDGLESVKARLLVYQQNESVFEEDIKLLKLKVQLRDNALVVLRQNLKKTEQERDDLKLKLEKFQTSSKNLSELLASQTNDKTGLGYNSQVFTRAMFDCDDYLSSESDESLPPSPIYDRYQSGNGYHAIPPPYTRTFMPPKPDLVFNNAPTDVETEHYDFNVKLNPTKLDNDLSHTHRPLASIIENWVSDSEDESETKTPQNVPSFIQPTEQVNSPRPSIQHVETSILTATSKTAILKPTSNGKCRNRTCFVCKSLDHLIKDCDYHDQKMAQTTPRNHAPRGHHKHYARIPLSNPQRHVVPTAVLTQSKLVSINAVRPVSTVVPKIKVTTPSQAKIIVTKTNSPPRRHINCSPSPKASTFSLKVTAVKALIVNAAQGNPQHALKDKEVIDSGCSRHMTGNMSYLSNFKELNGRYVAFGGNPKGGKISGKGKIRTGKLDFDDVYFVKELKFNLFSVLQMCDKKNSVLFTEIGCLVLSHEFKLPDENQVLLRVPRKNNMHNVNLKNIVPSGDLTSLFAKATLDESNLWYRRLGYINFKTMNKLVKCNLVRGLPSKVFENDHTCVACKNGKQHKASCKTKPVSYVTQPLYRLHMDLFGPTFVKILNKKSYCLVVTDDYSRFTWVFFLATKDETSSILKTFITGLENQLSLKVKVIRCDNGTEFKNNVLNQFCGMKGIKREFSIPRTPQQNGIAERKNKTLIEAARTILNKVLVTKPQNKTPYELLHGRTPSIGFMRPFGCPVTILNTLDSLGKFDGKVDEGFLVGYSVCSKSFRVFNSRTQIIQETLHVNFLESKPNVTGVQEQFDAKKTREENVQQYVLFLVWSSGYTNPQNTDGDAAFDEKEFEFDEKKPESEVNVSPSSSAQSKKQDYKTKREAKGKSPVESFTGYRNLSAEFEDLFDNSINKDNVAGTLVLAVGQLSSNSTNTFSVAGPSNAAASPTHGKSSYVDSSQLPNDPNMPELKDITYSDDEDDVATQTRSMTSMAKDQGGLSQINNDDFHTCMFACFLSQEEPKRVHQAPKDPSWIEAMQEELLQFKMQKFWVLVDLLHGKRAIGTKWVFRNKKDKRGIVVRNKYRLITQGYTQDEGINYEEVFAPVATIEAIRLFLAYASFMGFMVYQIDVKSAFLYETIEEEVYVCQPPGFKDPDYPEKIYVDDIIFGSTNKDLCKDFKKLMKDKFQMSSMGELTLFLGLQLLCTSAMDLESTAGLWVALSGIESLKRLLHVTNILSAGYLITPQMVLNSPCLTHIKNWLVQIKWSLSWLVQKQTALGVNTPRCDKDRLELIELTVFLLPSDKKVRVEVSAVDLQVSAVKENQEKDKIGSKPDKNGKRGEARKSQEQLQ
uniref:Uncharacterized protein n=1 Tax=Tanacetum cinerariifolium TaxID=118510 RepID=A0A6L2JN96_TANCI|nr:hypothetical protein [Tanacetum cinerariifolium]